jgi:hypothetical protein
MRKKEIEKVVSDLIKIELNENCHGVNQDGNVLWEDGARSDSYGGYIRDK